MSFLSAEKGNGDGDGRSHYGCSGGGDYGVAGRGRRCSCNAGGGDKSGGNGGHRRSNSGDDNDKLPV